MTNSTINTDSQKNAPVPEKKTKGPIRTEAVLPVTLFVVVCFLYFHFLFDGHIRKAMEWTATRIHGAEVNVGSVKTSFFNGSFALFNLQVTDKDQPTRNLIQIGEIRFQFIWDALLRAKFVVSDAGVDDIQIYSPRKKPGYVMPPPPPPKPGDKPGQLAVAQKQLLDQTQKEFSGNAVGDMVSLIAGTDSKDLAENIRGNLKSEAFIQSLDKELKEKEAAWKDRIQHLPNKDEFQALIERGKKLKFNTKDPKQFAADLKEANSLAKEADAKIKSAKELSDQLKADISKFNGEFNQIDDLVKQDVKDLETRLKIPNIDTKDLSKNIFGKMFASRLAGVQKYIVIAKKYMPPPKDKTKAPEEELVPPKRGTGKNYSFKITKGYPLFWLKRATISSVPSQDGFSGKVSGALTNVTTSPAVIQKPAILDVRGDFPNSNIYNSQLKITADHINQPHDTLDLNVGSFPLQNQNLVEGSSLNLGIAKAAGTSQLHASYQNLELALSMNSEFNNIEYNLTSNSAKTKEIVLSILNGIPKVTLEAKATGPFDHLNLSLNSNLGRELSAGLSKYVQAQIDALRKKAQDEIDSKVKPQKEKITKEYNKIKEQIDKVLKTHKDEIDKSQAEFKSETKQKQSNSKDKLKEDLKEKGKKLLKGLHF